MFSIQSRFAVAATVALIATLLGTNDLSYSMEAGPRLILGRRVGVAAAVEVLYFGLNDWDASQTVVGDNDLRIPGDLALATLDFFNADELTTSQSATIDNVKVNLWRRGNESPLDHGALPLLAVIRFASLPRFPRNACNHSRGGRRAGGLWKFLSGFARPSASLIGGPSGPRTQRRGKDAR